MKKKDVFCCLPFNSISVAPFGAIRVCCNNYNLPRNERGEYYSFNNDDFDLKEALNSDFYKELRLSMVKGERHPSCHRCWDIENQGGMSYRQAWENRYERRFESYIENMNPDGSLKQIRGDYVEFTLGNTCNLKCRMCNPFSSIQWLKEAKSLGLISEGEENELKNYNWFEKPKFASAVDSLLKSTDRLNILGGEPLIIPEQFQILQKAIDLGYASNMEVQYNTNLTKLDPRLLPMWTKFKRVFLNVSVDAVGELNEYIRHPMNWKKFLDNLQTLKGWAEVAPLSISLHCTFQALNVLELHRLYDFVYNLGYGFARIPFVIWVNYPEYHDPRILPRELREKAYRLQSDWIQSVDQSNLIDYEVSWLSMMKSHVENLLTDWPEEKRNTELERFRKITKSVDRLRGEDIGALIPDLKSILNK